MAYQQILYDVADPVATITLNRPEFLNAFTARMGDEIADALGRAERDRAVVGIVLTGAGKGFCAGADMKMLQSITSGATTTSGAADGTGADGIIDGAPVTRPGDPAAGDDLRGTYTYLMSIGKPIIAAINGAVAGMAVPLVLACDLRFMSTDAVLTTSFAQRGLVAEWGVAWQLSRLVGPSTALDLLLSARKVGGDEAARLGLVNRALPGDEILTAARDYIADLAQHCSPASMAAIKRQVYLDLHRGLAAAGSDAERLMAESFGRPDVAEGVQSFVDRRDPSFARIGDGGRR